jgi:hypothetical protein
MQLNPVMKKPRTQFDPENDFRTQLGTAEKIPGYAPVAERSFSVLKRMNNYIRTIMSQERLNSLAILSIESSNGKYSNNSHH